MVTILSFWCYFLGRQVGKTMACNRIYIHLGFSLLCYIQQMLTYAVFLKKSVLFSSFFFTVTIYTSCKNSVFYLTGTQTCFESADLTLVKTSACILELAGPVVLLIITCVIKLWSLVSIGHFYVAVYFLSEGNINSPNSFIKYPKLKYIEDVLTPIIEVF